MFKRFRFLAGALLLASVAFVQAQTKLAVGDPAPALKVGTWFQGKPIQGFEKGHVYVVEFWATWCGPCHKAIPHLNKLAKKHEGKATILGVNVWDDAKNDTQVREFLDKLEEKMTYSAVRDTNHEMLSKWLQAADQKGIPCAFVVDKEGKIAWIGHPMGDLEKVLAGVVDGTYKTPESAPKAPPTAEELLQAKAQSVRNQGQSLSEQSLHEKALAVYDEALAEEPKLRPYLFTSRLTTLFYVNEKQAISELRARIDQERPQDGRFVKGTFPKIEVTVEPKYLNVLFAVAYLDHLSPEAYAYIASELKPIVTQYPVHQFWVMQMYASAAYKAGEGTTVVAVLEQAIQQMEELEKLEGESMALLIHIARQELQRYR